MDSESVAFVEGLYYDPFAKAELNRDEIASLSHIHSEYEDRAADINDAMYTSSEQRSERQKLDRMVAKLQPAVTTDVAADFVKSVIEGHDVRDSFGSDLSPREISEKKLSHSIEHRYGVVLSQKDVSRVTDCVEMLLGHEQGKGFVDARNLLAPTIYGPNKGVIPDYGVTDFSRRFEIEGILQARYKECVNGNRNMVPSELLYTIDNPMPPVFSVHQVLDSYGQEPALPSSEKGGFAVIGLDDVPPYERGRAALQEGMKTGKLNLFEDYKSAVFAHSLTGQTCLCAFSSVNASQIVFDAAVSFGGREDAVMPDFNVFANSDTKDIWPKLPGVSVHAPSFTVAEKGRNTYFDVLCARGAKGLSTQLKAAGLEKQTFRKKCQER